MASALMACLAIFASTADAQVTTIAPTHLTMKTIATVNLSKVAANAAVALRTPPMVESPEQLQRMQSQRAAAVNRRIPIASRSRAAVAEARMRAALLPLPQAATIPFVEPRAPMLFGFNGLNALDSAIGQGLDVNAPTVGFGIEPPDQALCVGNGEIVEMTNLEFAVYDTSGNRTQGPLTLSSVFGVPPSDFTSDPKCYYDAPTNTYYMILTDLQDITALNHSSLLVAVMPAGSTTVTDYAIDTTDDGSNGISDAGCPCFGDQPLLGADQFGIYLTTNEFALAALIDPTSTVFNGSQIYFISKSDLAAAIASPRVFSINGGVPLASDLASSMQPSTSPGGAFATAYGGTEFFMASLDFAGTGDDRIAVWAMTNTCYLASSPCGGLPGFTPTPPILRARTYSIPFPAKQKAGPIPYGDLTGNPLERIDTGDDRMGQVVYAHGQLYAALDTQVQVGGAVQAGIEYFRVKPSFRTKATPGGPQSIFSARLTRSGYVAHTSTDIYYPSIGVTAKGKAVMVFSLSGTNMYPSAGWMPIAKAGPRQIHIEAAGVGPDDGFTGYEGGGVARWGDYSAAVADGNDIWMATEYIPSACTDTEYAIDPLCAMTRAPEANWGTSISEFIPRRRCISQPFNPVPCVQRAGVTP